MVNDNTNRANLTHSKWAKSITSDEDSVESLSFSLSRRDPHPFVSGGDPIGCGVEIGG